MNRRPGVAVLSVLLVAAALGSTAYSFRQSRQLRTQMRGRVERLQQVRALATGSGNTHERVQAFAASEKTLPAAIKAMLANHLPDVQAQVVEAEPRPAGSGVVLRSTSLQFEAVDLSLLGAFIERLESYDPPWKMVACTLRAVPGRPGHARAKLTLEALEALPGAPLKIEAEP